MTSKNSKKNIIGGQHGIQGIKVYIGDVQKCLSILPDECVDCAITSPPYWKQRDYKHPQQIGQESSSLEYIEKLVGIFNHL